MDKFNLTTPKIAQQATEAKETAEKAATSKWSINLARLGYAVKGVVYIIIGGLAVMAAIGSGGDTTDPKGVIENISGQPFGQLLLVIIALGLFGYALWSFSRAIFDLDGKGTKPKGIVTRIGYGISGVAYGGLAIAALSLIFGTGNSGGGSEATAKTWTAQLLGLPFGVALLIIVGLIIIGFAATQFYKAYSTKFQEEFNISQMSAKAQQALISLGRIGLAARGIVFSLIGFFLIVAAVKYNPDEARGLAGTLDELARQSYGQILLGVVAVGLVAYGIYCLLEARYHNFNKKAETD